MSRPQPPPQDGCTPIRDYAVIGDCHGVALVGRHGGIDWCCLRRFDAEPLFCRLLDRESGGFFGIRPTAEHEVQRDYLPETNILRTEFHTTQGRITVTDFMPVGRTETATPEDGVSLTAPFWVIRIVEGVEGHVPIEITYRPSGPGFGREQARIESVSDGVAMHDGPRLYSPVPMKVMYGTAQGEAAVDAGMRLAFIISAEDVGRIDPTDVAPRLLDITAALWREWSARCCYTGRYRDWVLRSALTLKLLTYAPTGALVAAPTTSLPEWPGGERNWDYRYCWLRDATFTLYALAALGYHDEAGAFNEFLRDSLAKTFPTIRIMYGIDGETELPEQTLDHLAGYCDSRPVRVGNGAYTQQQHDVYGEVLDWALLYNTLGGNVALGESRLLRAMVDEVTRLWEEPGQGIWETRSAPQHHVYSEIMCWVALDRGIRLFGDVEGRWGRIRSRIANAVHERGIDPNKGHLRASFEDGDLDAAVLMTPLLGFPLDEEVLAATVEAVNDRLMDNGYVRRYSHVDGLRGEEGAFLACSFWLVDALLFLDRPAEAQALFERLIEEGNNVGLFSEEIDPNSGDLLGNFPQALTHLAVIRSAFAIHLYEAGGAGAISGSHSDRVRRHRGPESSHPLWESFRNECRESRAAFTERSVLHPHLTA